jgi:hypothetical protein
MGKESFAFIIVDKKAGGSMATKGRESLLYSMETVMFSQ